MVNPRVLLILWDYPFDCRRAPVSRAYHLFKEIRRVIPDTYLIFAGGDTNRELSENVVLLGCEKEASSNTMKQVLYSFKACLQTLRFVYSHKIDTVIMRGVGTAFLMPLLQIIGIRVFYDFHGFLYKDLEMKKRPKIVVMGVRHLEWYLLRNSGRIIIVSSGVEQQMKADIGSIHSSCVYLPNGVDLNKNGGTPASRKVSLSHRIPTVGFLGNWEVFMRIEDICDAAQYLKDMNVLIIGHGANAPALFQKYAGYSNIIFTGQLEPEDARLQLQQIDVCVIPYDKNDPHAETPDFFSSRKTKEYLAAGKPIIVSNAVGRESWLVEGVHCLIYESGNPRDLAEKISTLLDDTNLYNKMSCANAKLAQEVTWSKAVDRSGIIREVLHSKSNSVQNG